MKDSYIAAYLIIHDTRIDQLLLKLTFEQQDALIVAAIRWVRNVFAEQLDAHAEALETELLRKLKGAQKKIKVAREKAVALLTAHSSLLQSGFHSTHCSRQSNTSLASLHKALWGSG